MRFRAPEPVSYKIDLALGRVDALGGLLLKGMEHISRSDKLHRVIAR